MNPKLTETETRTKLVEIIKPLDEDKLNTSVQKGTWTIAQIVEHLAVAEVRFLALIEEAISKQRIGTAAEQDFSILRDRSVKNESTARTIHCSP